MKSIARLFRNAKRRSLVRDERGVAAVEFALISAAMFAMLSAAVDATQAVTIRRDLNRLTAEIAQVLAACSDQLCVDLTIVSIMDRRANIAPQLETIQLGMVRFSKKNNQIDGNSLGGNMTYLPADMNTRALALLREGDSGVGVLATYTHQPIILGLARDWGFTTMNFRSSAMTIRQRAP
jgi:Flp pilus assembly protein TadG